MTRARNAKQPTKQARQVEAVRLERLRIIYEQAPVGIFETDLDGRFLRVNDRFCVLTGRSRDELLSHRSADITHRDDLTRDREAFERVRSGELPSVRVEKRYVHRDGHTVWAEIYRFAIADATGKLQFTVGIAEDITELKNAEAELRFADQRKNDFIAMLAHELRNPLTPLANVAHLLRTPGLPEHTLQWAHDVLDRQLSSLRRMVDDLLDVSRISREKIRLQRERVDLAQLINRSLDSTRELFRARGLHVSSEVPTTPIVLFADPVRLEQVLGNLLNNASKFTPQGGHVAIVTTLLPSRREVAIQVRDDGDGIDGNTLPHVFEMFRQADTSLERSHGGLGIGLTLVRQLVELHGGKVEAASDGLMQGSVFTVRLPLVQAPLDAAAERAEMQASAVADGARRILIIDDNVDAATSLAMLLRHDRHTVEVAHSGPTGLDLARRFRPEVVLLDLGMPGMNGFDVALRLREDAAGGKLVLVATSGYSGEDVLRRAHDAGFDEYITKPIDLDPLRALLNRKDIAAH